MSTANTELRLIRLMSEDPSLQIDILEFMGPDLWHNWMISAFSALEKYANRQEYDEFLKRFSWLLSQRVKTGVW